MSELEAIYRTERGRVLASLIRLLGDFDSAEEAVHDAFLAASQQWPRDGVPANPRTWLVSAGRFKAVDKLRQRGRLARAAPELQRDSENNVQPDKELIEDDTLRLIFTCCHPALPPDAQIAMTLREVCGLKTEEIAAAFLATPAAIAQRIVRAKTRIRDLALPYAVPPPSEWDARLEAVLHTVYLIFNEGYAASSGDSHVRRELCHEAIRLARLLRDLRPGADIDGLLALLLLHDSRSAARLSSVGAIVLLSEQDRTLWNRAGIAEATGLVARAFAMPPLGSYTIQAAIAATHARASAYAKTDWPSIVRFYDLLLVANPSPVVALNRAAAIGERDGPAAGLALVDDLLAAGELKTYRFAYSARADLLRRLGRDEQARAAYAQALALTSQGAERALIERRLGELGDP